MKKHAKKIITALLVIAMLVPTAAMIFSSAAITSYPVELAFNNIFVLDKWASNKPSTTIAAEGGQNKPDKLDIDITNGTVVFKNVYSDEAYTGFSMEQNNPTLNMMFYNTEVEPNATYTFAYNVTQTTNGVVPYVFYFDKDYKYIDLACALTYENGNQSFEFTTPANACYIQVRFTVKDTGTATFSNIFISKKIPGSVSNTNYDHRRVYTYSISNPSVYGELPVPTDVPSGYVFAGWYTGVNGTGELITENTAIKNQSFTVYPKYEPIVDSLSIKTNAAKTNYALGERVNSTGLVLEATVAGKTTTVDSGFRCTPEYLTATGTQTVTVHYGGKTVTYQVNVGSSVSKSIVFDGTAINVDTANNVYYINKMAATAFNRYSLTYYSDSYVKGIIKYQDNSTEEFFLEPSSNSKRADGNGEFSSYVDGYLTKVLSKEQETSKVTSEAKSGIQTISFELLDNKTGNFELLSVSTSLKNPMNPEMTGDSIMASTLKLFNNDQYTVGIDILNGGVIAYLAVTNSNIESRVYKINGQNVTKVDYADKLDATYGTDYISVNTNVNLINYFDTGRYLQQSYYGTDQPPYETGYYNNSDWHYNPVQGGNVVGEASKVIDYEINEQENYIYVKTRPLDWAKWSDDFANKVSNDDFDPKYGNEDYITDTYVEAKYVFEDGMIKVYNRMVDYSGLPSAITTQELPAFYTIEPLNQYVRTDMSTADGVWDFDAKLKYDSEPEFWGLTDQTYLNTYYPNGGYTVDSYTPEHWGAFMASQDNDSFGIGIYSNESTELFYGVYPAKYSGLATRHAQTSNPAFEANTSYIAPTAVRTFESYNPSEYSYYISTGTATQIRNAFGALNSADYKEELEAQQSAGKVIVPETVYMTPSTGKSTTGQYYVNNSIDTSTNTVKLEQSNNNTVGYVQLYIPNAKSVTYTVSYSSGTNAGDVVASGEGTVHNFNSSGYLALNSTTISVTSGLAATQTSTAEWKFTVTMNDGSTRTYYAYTTLYSPYYYPVGAATRAKTNSGAYAQSIAWVSGVHGYTKNTDDSKYWIAVTNETKSNESADVTERGTYYVKTSSKAMVPLIYGVDAGSNAKEAVKSWLSTSAPGGGITDPTIRYFSLNNKSSNGGVMVADISPVANITVDTSRYTNLNQIPNLTVGYNVTDTDGAGSVYWYASDFTDVAHLYTKADNGTTSGKPCFFNWTKTTGKDSIDDYEDEWFNGASAGKIYKGSATSSTSDYGTGVEYNSSYNRTIVTGSATYDYMFKGAQHTYNGNRAYSINFVQLRATNVNKANLRDLVLKGSSFNESNYTPDSWAIFKNALAAAGAVLGNPGSTTDQVTTAYNDLKSAIDNLATFVYFHTGVATGTVNYLDNNTIGNGTALAILGVGGNTRWEYQDDYTIFSAVRNENYYTFMGWSTSPDTDYRDTDKYYTQNFSTDKLMGGGFNQNFYAVWKEHSYTVKFNVNGASTTLADKTVNYTESFSLPTAEDCTKEGYRLVGWSANGTTYVPGQSLSGLTVTDGATITFTAVWAESQYTVVYDANGGSGTIASKTATYTESFALASSGFTKDGCTLLGWATSASATTPEYQLGQTVSKLTRSNSITLYAVWQEASYTVAYNANGGSGSIASKTATYSESFALASTGFTREGYTLLGWATNASATTAEYQLGQTVSKLSSTNGATITLYAVWQEGNYTVIYDANGGNGTIASQAVRYTESFTLPSSGFTRDGCTLLGWSINISATTPEYQLGQTVSKLADSGTITLYAVWRFDDLLTEDVVVLDFATPIVISPTDNDESLRGFAYSVVGISFDGEDYASTLDGEYGTFVLDDSRKITYTPSEVINGTEEIYYHVSVNTNGTNSTFTDTITVVPASNILYEETEFTVSNTTGVEWTPVGTASTAKQTSSTEKDVYGYDSNTNGYNKISNYSNGSALSVTVDADNKRSQNLSFEFEGTGFDLNGACGYNTGVMIVSVKNLSTNKMVKSYIVDTYYSDLNDKGNSRYNDTLYQVPIVNETTLPYDNYLIQISASYLSSMSGALSTQALGEESNINAAASIDEDALRAALTEIGMEYILDAEEVNVVWFDEDSVLNGGDGVNTIEEGMLETQAVTELLNIVDSVRVYNPITDGDLYYIDSEKGAQYYNVIDNLVNADGSFTAQSLFSYISGKDKETITIENYDSVGPKDELYLSSGTDAVAFSIKDFDSSTSKIMISLKAASTSTADPKVNVKIGDKNFDVTSNTEMYYDITDFVENGTITIQNMTPGTLLSVGSVKITSTINQVALLSSDLDLATASFMMMASSSTVEPNAPEAPAAPEDTTDPNTSTEHWIVGLIRWIIANLKKLFASANSALVFKKGVR